MSAPAGWHPQEDGQERFWDGSQWTEQYRPPGNNHEAMAASGRTAKAGMAKFKPWMGYVGAGLAGLLIGIPLGASDNNNDATAAAGLVSAPTVTVRSTTTSTPEATEEPAAAQAPDVATAALSPKDFKIRVKVLTKKCFGSAGCNVTYRIDPEYVGSAPLPDGTVEVTYTVKGAEDPIINTFTIEDGEASFESEERASTSSSKKTLTAAATDVFVS
jgi:hypothetical protein